jgi:hypothetical protein
MRGIDLFMIMEKEQPALRETSWGRLTWQSQARWAHAAALVTDEIDLVTTERKKVWNR